jgi:hypothetical protein
MVARVLALSALLALGHSKAIVTNNCRKDVYIWSVPEKSDLANNLSISPGKRYEEPWRSGTAVSPGVAIKVTTEPDGIHTGKSEINFQYDVDASDSTKIWINLATIRGTDFDTATLNTCYGGYKGSSVPIKQCSCTDDIELVLCGSERTVPSQDTTPLRVISTCIGLVGEQDDALNPRMCSGRVVGPKRMPMLPEEQEDQWLDEGVGTIPLKTVMRLEAAKHAASQDAEAHNAPRPRSTAAVKPETNTKNSMNSAPLCSLLHEAWPDAQCDEQMAQHNAKLFFQDNCGEKTKNMFPGASCEAIRHQMEQIFPGVATLPISVTQDSHRTLCIKPFYARFLRFWGSKPVVKTVFNNQLISAPLFPDRSWTSDAETCRHSTWMVQPVRDGGSRCVHPFCAAGGHLGGDCSEVENELEELSKAAGWKIDWTSDDDVCPSKRTTTEKRDVISAHEHSALTQRQAVNVTLGTGHRWNDIRKVCITTANEKLGKYWGASDTEDLVQELFPGTSWTANLDDCSPQAISESRAYHHKLIDKKQDKEKKCVVNCEGKTCKRVKKELNKLSKDVGENWSWTDDEGLCARLSNITFGSDGPMADKCVMGRNAINKLSAHWGDARRNILGDIFPKIHIYLSESSSESEGDCRDFTYDQAARTWFRDHRAKGKRVQRCVSPYCKPFNADCSDVEDLLEEVSKNLGHAIDWTTDDDACPKDAAILPVGNVGLDKIAFGGQGPELCRNILGYALVARLRGYWGQEAEDVLHDIFPSLPHFQLSTDCDQGGNHIMAAQKWFRDHRVKGGKRCVEPYCKPFNADCSDVEDDLEKLSETIGQNIDWTTDDDVCLVKVFNPVSHLPYPYLYKPHGDPTTYTYNTSLPLVCARAYCAPRVPGVDCALVHRDFGRLFQIEAVLPVIGDTTSERVCGTKPLLLLPVVNDQAHKQKVCVKELCTIFESAYGKKCFALLYHLQSYYKSVHNVNIVPSIDDCVCGK